MVAVGELFLSAFIQMLVQQLLYPELVKFASQEGIGQKLDKWKNFVQDSGWLDDLKDLAYDVDDILDEFNMEVLRSNSMGENRASKSKVRNLIPACCTGFTPSAVKMNIRLGPKIKEITDRFNKIEKQKDYLDLRETVDGRRPNRERERLQPTSVMNEARICGREKDKENVVELLLTENSSDAGVRVVSIVGMGGMGKTTLAQLVYNDEKLIGIFEVKAWVCVSDDFDVIRVTKAVLESVSDSEKCDGKALDWLQVKLKEKLRGKKYLVILDDVWTEDYEEWKKLHAPHDAGAPGSRILITTRSEQVSSMMSKLPSEFEKLVNLRHLNIKGARSLEGMPSRMGKLTCLQTLSDFVVGEGSCFGIQELGPLSHL
ncbi:putative disease resistance RPP13-like protein 1 [Morella rubra]|uniref:Putative disease resistance RPP13-like protein 1 n=1 Tax=Morella rubra TaxID=262757 RepID=A0A6A1W6K4_9ROSI|nr:putative disease resistance RPP13-like protein 1 [Morella rubra]